MNTKSNPILNLSILGISLLLSLNSWAGGGKRARLPAPAPAPVIVPRSGGPTFAYIGHEAVAGVDVIDTSSQTLLGQIGWRSGGEFVVVTPDHQKIILGSQDIPYLMEVSAITGRETRRINLPAAGTFGVTALAISHDGGVIYFRDLAQNFYAMDYATGQITHSALTNAPILYPDFTRSNQILLSPDGRTAYVVGNAHLKIYNTQTFAVEQNFPQELKTFMLSPDGTKGYLALGSGGFMVLNTATRLLDPQATNLHFYYDYGYNHVENVQDLYAPMALSPDGRLLYYFITSYGHYEVTTPRAQHYLASWDLVAGQFGPEFPVNEAATSALALSPDQPLAYFLFRHTTNAAQGKVTVFDLNQGQVVNQISLAFAPTDIAFVTNPLTPNPLPASEVIPVPQPTAPPFPTISNGAPKLYAAGGNWAGASPTIPDLHIEFQIGVYDPTSLARQELFPTELALGQIFKISPDGRTIFGSRNLGNTASLDLLGIDRLTHQITETYHFPTVGWLSQIEFSPTGDIVFVRTGDTLHRIDRRTGARMSTPANRAQESGRITSFSLSRDGATIYASNGTYNRLEILRASDLSVIDRIQYLPFSDAIMFSQDNQRAYVSINFENPILGSGIAVIRTADREVLNQIHLPRATPANFELTGDGHFLYVRYYYDPNITIVDLQTNQIVQDSRLCDPFIYPQDPSNSTYFYYVEALATSGNQMFAACTNGKISVFDTASNTVTNTVDLSAEMGYVFDLFVSSNDPQSCPADFNHDGVASQQDVFDFLAAYHSGVLSADVNHNGSVSVQDLFDFLAAYNQGCH